MPIADLHGLTQQMFDAVSSGASQVEDFYKENVSSRNRKRNRDIFEFADLANVDAGIGDVTRLMGLMLSMKNADKIHKVVSNTYKSLKQSHPQLGEPITRGLAFLSARYPNQFGAVKQIDKVLTPGVSGSAETLTKKIRLNPNIISSTNKAARHGMHEIGHIAEETRLVNRANARRMEKLGAKVNPRLLEPDIIASDTKRLQDIRNPIDPNVDREGYIQQLHEINARRAGQTAERSFDKFPEFIEEWGKRQGLDFNQALRKMFEGVTK